MSWEDASVMVMAVNERRTSLSQAPPLSPCPSLSRASSVWQQDQQEPRLTSGRNSTDGILIGPSSDNITAPYGATGPSLMSRLAAAMPIPTSTHNAAASGARSVARRATVSLCGTPPTSCLSSSLPAAGGFGTFSLQTQSSMDAPVLRYARSLSRRSTEQP